MGRPKRSFLLTVEETSSPPATLPDSHVIARVEKAEGNNLYSVQSAHAGEFLLVELSARFRSQIWIKRGGYVVVDTNAFKDRENKLNGEIVNVIRDEKLWRKQTYWPSQFAKKPIYDDVSDENSSTVGRIPPSDDSDTSI